MPRLQVVLLANWGLGLEVLKTLHRMTEVAVSLVATQYQPSCADRWYNAVYEFAHRCRYDAISSDTLSFERLHALLRNADVDLLVVHGYRRVLPESVFAAPRCGSVNIHASLLPKYRGPAPTYWVLRNGESFTGLTCHYMDRGIDSGDIIHQVKIPVKHHDTVETVIERQKKVVSQLVVASIARIVDPRFTALPQRHNAATYAPRPDQEDRSG